jgi:uncharacterized protein
MPHSKSIPSYWRRIPEWYRLEGVKCETCETAYFPSRSLCPTCRREGKLSPFKFSGKGTIYSYTRIYAPPEGMEFQKPYHLAIVELDEGSRITAQIVDSKAESVDIGAKVTSVFRKIREGGTEGIIQYGYKFTIAE